VGGCNTPRRAASRRATPPSCALQVSAAMYRLQNSAFESLANRHGLWFWVDPACNLRTPDGKPRGAASWPELVASLAGQSLNKWIVRVATPLRVLDLRSVADVGPRLFDATDPETVNSGLADVVDETGLDGFLRTHDDGLEEVWITQRAARKLEVVRCTLVDSVDAVVAKA
jgi:hypothetical protein